MACEIATIEAASASLVREFLSRKGCKATLQQLDVELPRTEASISNRQLLMKHLNLEKLMKKNKEDSQPLKAMLEIMTKYFLQRKSPGNSENTSPYKSESRSALGFSSDSSFGPQIDKPLDSPALESLLGPKTAVLSARREKGSSDLIVDEDVSGETVMGRGKSDVLENLPLESPQQYNIKPQASRPLSAKRGTGMSGMILSNDDALSKNRRHFNRPQRVLVSQEQGPRRDMTTSQANSHSTGELTINGRAVTDTMGSKSNSRLSSSAKAPKNYSENARSNLETAPRKQSSEDPPVSFEALLLKGEERASLLQTVGASKREVPEPEQSYNVETSSMVGQKSRQKQKATTSESPPSNTVEMQDLEFGDIDDHDTSFRNLELKPSHTMQKPGKLTKIPSTPIDLKTAIALKNIVLGSPCQRYNDEWLLQAFTFCDMPNLKYGIVQKKGGPCGVLAAVQACMVQEMLFGPNRVPDNYKNISRADRSKMLAYAISTILWRAGDNTSAVVTVPSDTSHILSSTKFKHDDVTEKLNLYSFTSYDELSSFLLQSISQFETDGCAGVIQLMYSAILSRKSHRVRADFDVPEENTMIGSHGYCTQELVNLLVTGRAVSNVFNDTVQLDSGTVGEPLILKGIAGRADIGFLSLFEHYKSCQVGTYFKTPKNPVWVVCSESHFSVLFSPRRDLVSDWKAEKRFDLIYYDGLSRQQEEIRLTISTLNQSYKPPVSEEDLVPPLEHCIHTKWPDAEIDWNGYEPIL